MKYITSLILATITSFIPVFSLTENAVAHPHYRYQRTTHIRRYRTCNGRNRYRYYRGKYYRCYYRSRYRRHH